MPRAVMIELDYAKLAAAPVATDPFPHVLVPDFVPPASLKAVLADLPPLGKRGSFPVDSVKLGPHAAALMEAMEGLPLRAAIERLFGLDLRGSPTMVTLRGWTSERDGRIHCDSLAKRVTVLLYLNRGDGCLEPAGRLPAAAAGTYRPGGFRCRGAAGERNTAGVPQRADDMARAPAVCRTTLQRAAQLHDDGRQGAERTAPAPDFRVREAADPGGLRLVLTGLGSVTCPAMTEQRCGAFGMASCRGPRRQPPRPLGVPNLGNSQGRPAIRADIANTIGSYAHRAWCRN